MRDTETRPFEQAEASLATRVARSWRRRPGVVGPGSSGPVRTRTSDVAPDGLDLEGGLERADASQGILEPRGPAAPGGGGEQPRRRLRWFGWIRGGVFHVQGRP